MRAQGNIGAVLSLADDDEMTRYTLMHKYRRATMLPVVLLQRQLYVALISFYPAVFTILHLCIPHPIPFRNTY